MNLDPPVLVLFNAGFCSFPALKIQTWAALQIAYYKIPEYVRFVTDFPATLRGKIQKYKIRDFEIEARGLQSVANAATA